MDRLVQSNETAGQEQRDLLAALRALDADLVIQGPEELAGRDPGAHPDNFAGGLVAQPGSTQAAAALIAWAIRHDVPVVAQGGRTGLVGGSLSKPGEIVISSQRLAAI